MRSCNAHILSGTHNYTEIDVFPIFLYVILNNCIPFATFVIYSEFVILAVVVFVYFLN